MLQNGLACAEGAGHAEGAALGHRQEGVDGADLRYQRFVGTQALLIAADSLLHRPGEDHGQLLFLAVFVFQHRNGVADIIHALFPNGLHPPLALEVEGHHDQMGEQTLGDAAHGVAGGDEITGGHLRGELPVLIGDGIQIYAPLQKETAFFRKLRQGILQAVKHLRQKAWPKLNAHQFAGKLDLVAHTDAACHFIDLHAGRIAVHTDDLALEALVTDEDIANFVFSHGAGKGGCHQIPVHSGHISCHFVHFDSPVSL